MGFTAAEFFELNECSHAGLFKSEEPAWAALARIAEYAGSFFRDTWPLQGITGLISEPLVIVNGELILDGAVALSVSGPKNKLVIEVDGEKVADAAVVMPGAYLFDDRVIIGPGTVVEPGALIKGPAVIGKNTEVRQGAYLRGDCVVGDRCVVGHTTEMKNAVMLDDAKAGHFAYLGDCILGRHVNLGAGTKIANLKIGEGTISVRTPDGGRLETGLRKLGAILGDHTETGCNSVTSPGSLIGPRGVVFPCVNVPAGLYAPGSVISSTDEGLALRRGRRS